MVKNDNVSFELEHIYMRSKYFSATTPIHKDFRTQGLIAWDNEKYAHIYVNTIVLVLTGKPTYSDAIYIQMST